MNNFKEKSDLTIALIQVDNLTKLTEDNPQKQYIYSHLVQIKFELERQLSLTKSQESTMIEK